MILYLCRTRNPRNRKSGFMVPAWNFLFIFCSF